MPGGAAITLFLDVAPGTEAAHDDWHTHEHLVERLAIPGFLRGSRWRALEGGPRIFVLYEAANVEVLTGPDYLARLNHPTPWTTRTMASYRGMARGLCRVVTRHGAGLGGFLAALRFSGRLEVEASLERLVREPGFGSALVLASAAAPEMTAEQRLRGRDAPVDRVVLVTGYEEGPVRELARAHGGTPYRLDYLLSADDAAGAAGAAAG